jgi:caffeoyl-CoA O-methyltransferase
LRLGPGLDTVRALPANEQFDVAFVDADKRGYARYIDEIVPRLRRNGVILVDNTLWSGRVLDATDDSTDTAALRAFNDKVTGDSRLFTVQLPIADGLTLLQKL